MRIEITDARKRFGRVEALKGVDLVVPTGRRIALVGPNGSGKSTLIRAMLGLIEHEGTILLDGLSPWQDRVRVAKRLAYVPQIAPALGATVAEIVSLVVATRGIGRETIFDAAKKLDLDLTELARRPFRNLSGGMKQKALLALAFAAKPKLLVMDEPTASLDVRAREQFLRLCAELAPDVTVVLCSHRLDDIRELADQVVEMADGRIVGAREKVSVPEVGALVLGGIS